MACLSFPGNVQRYTVQCVLPINMYTEKIYVFLWFWMVFVAAVSVFNLVTWLIRFFLTSDSVKYMKVRRAWSEEFRVSFGVSQHTMKKKRMQHNGRLFGVT